MKKHDLLKRLDSELIEKLYSFCYQRTRNSHEANDLCSDIIYALVRTANTNGEINDIYAFIWRIARNVYADYSKARKARSERIVNVDQDTYFADIEAEDGSDTDEDAEALKLIYHQIANLTKIYRDVMIRHYLDGISTRDIAKITGSSETTVRQRLFSARNKIKCEVEKMENNSKQATSKPVALQNINITIVGNGNPIGNDPRGTLDRVLSNHVVWLCKDKPKTASEIAEELNVPTVYVEDELEIQARGDRSNGYGLLRKLDNGKYAINFILFDSKQIEEVMSFYADAAPELTDKTIAHFEAYKEEYLAFPYLNKKPDFNLIKWQQIKSILWCLPRKVGLILAEKYFADITPSQKPFTVAGYEYTKDYFFQGQDGQDASNICGYDHMICYNIYNPYIIPHFRCGHNFATDDTFQFALRALNGMNVNELTSDYMKESAARAIEDGYIYREGDMLYTKILAFNRSDADELYKTSDKFDSEYISDIAHKIAEKLYKFIVKNVPEHLLPEWRCANMLADSELAGAVISSLVEEKRYLIPPENGLGAEGIWMSIRK